MHNILLATILLPAVGALVAWLFASRGLAAVRAVALITAGITLALAAHLVVQYWNDQGLKGNYAVQEFRWLGEAAKIHFAFGLDGLSVWMFGLSALLTFTAVLVSWDAVKDRPAGFYALLMLLECGMIGVFSARDIILFYIFFEFTLIPLYFLIGIWGHEERRYAANKFFLFTFTGSVVALLGLIGIVLWGYNATGELTFSIPQLHELLGTHPIPMDAAHGYLQLLIFLALVCGFAVKVPLVPLHTWLPLAHTRSAHRRQYRPGRHSIETRHVWHFALLPADVARRHGHVHALDYVAGCDWHRLRGAGVAGAGQLEKTRRLQQRQPHGFRCPRLLRAQSHQLAGRHSADDQSRFFQRRPVCRRRHDLRTLSHATNQRAWRLGQAHANSGDVHADFHHVEHWSAGAERLRRRIHDSARHVSACLVRRRVRWARNSWSSPCWRSAALCWAPGTCYGWLNACFLVRSKKAVFPPLTLAKFAISSSTKSLALSPLVVFIVWIGVYPQLFLKPIAPAAETILARTSQPLENYYAKRQVAALEIATPAHTPKAALQTAIVPPETN